MNLRTFIIILQQNTSLSSQATQLNRLFRNCSTLYSTQSVYSYNIYMQYMHINYLLGQSLKLGRLECSAVQGRLWFQNPCENYHLANSFS